MTEEMKMDQEKILALMDKARPFLAEAMELALKHDRYFEDDYDDSDEFQNIVQNVICAGRHVDEYWEPIG
jgi:hypothetical protein